MEIHKNYTTINSKLTNKLFIFYCCYYVDYYFVYNYFYHSLSFNDEKLLK